MTTINELPQGWQWVKLGDVCMNTFTKNPNLEPDNSFYYVDIASVDNISKKIVSPKLTLGKEASSRARKIILENDVIISTTRPNLNAVAIIPKELNNQIASTGFCVLRVNSNLLESNYLFNFVKSDFFIENLSNLVNGALYPAVTDKQVLSQYIPLPPLTEQQRLANLLTEKLNIIEQAKEKIDAQLKAAEDLTAAYLREVFESEEAKTWEWVKLVDVCQKIDYGYTSSAVHENKEPKFLRITDIQNNKVEWDKVPSCDISIVEEEKNKLLNNDIVFARTGATVGKSFLIKKPPRAVFASYLIRVQPSQNKVFSNYLYLFFQSDNYWLQILGSARGGAQPNVNATLLGQLIFPLPPIEKQKQLADYLTEKLATVEQLKTALKTQREAINQLPAALLKQAFNGKL